jgi:RimJ/RimL family protein N-acetyltransferase
MTKHPATAPAIAELLRDEVFRIETPRLWLRWPVAEDTDALQVAAARKCVADHTASWPYPLPEGFAADRIARIREANPTGRGLSLVLTRKVNPARAIGLVGVRGLPDGRLDLGYLLDYGSHGRGLMTEAVSSLLFNLFTYGQPTLIEASVMPHNVTSRRVLVKCGFQEGARSHVEAPARGGPVEAVTYELTRTAWRAQVARDRAIRVRGTTDRFLERGARVA